MNYRYKGSGFRINVNVGEETPAEAQKRLLAEQPNVDRPSTATLRSQVNLVHAIESLDATSQDPQKHLVKALREFAAVTHGLITEP